MLIRVSARLGRSVGVGSPALVVYDEFFIQIERARGLEPLLGLWCNFPVLPAALAFVPPSARLRHGLWRRPHEFPPLVACPRCDFVRMHPNLRKRRTVRGEDRCSLLCS